MSYNPSSYGYALNSTSPFTSPLRLPYARPRAIYGGAGQDLPRVLPVRWGLQFGLLSFDSQNGGRTPGFHPNPSPDIV